MSGFGTIAGIIAGYKAGQIGEQEANKLLKQIGFDEDLSTILSAGVGLVSGFVIGDAVADAFSEGISSIFGD